MQNLDRKLYYLMNDFVVQEHVCNLRCSYCLNFENENLKPGKPWKPLEHIDLKPAGFGWHRAREMLARCRELADAPLLRIAGGEVMAIKGSVDFIERVAPDWEKVQILTNATFLCQSIGRLARLPNLNLCCSLDGHTPELNAERTPNPKWGARIIDGFLAAVKAGIPVEVYTVLTSHNAEALYDFVCWLRNLLRKADLRVLPFPVRGKVATRLLPEPRQFHGVTRLLDEYDAFADILPPKAYFERLWDISQGAERRHRCRIPLSIMQTFDDGVLAACSNCWATPLGNLRNKKSVFEQIGRANIHRLFLRTPPRVSFCNGCFTPSDVINVYLDGDCSLEELAAMHLYASPSVQERLRLLRKAWSGGGSAAVWDPLDGDQPEAGGAARC